ncbi:hypothetical protein ACFQV2_31855 [Actinokineospora soli]|uniref:Uncharacterized protein n=1 Tax=Actinokineospora soli TaxID=1048753 RepID=A0ABW2TTZ2_9PSEU
MHRCNTGPDHFESRHAGCEGATAEHVLGYVAGYAALTRSVDHHGDHWVSVDGPAAGHRVEHRYGYTALTAEPGTVALTSCRDGVDQFLSLDTACGGKTVLGPIGRVWTEKPEGPPSRLLHACRAWGERFVSDRPDCEGHTVDGVLGHVVDAPRQVA